MKMRIARVVLGSVLVGLGAWFFLVPACMTLWFITTDDGLRGDGPSAFAIHVHRDVSKRYPKYVRERIVSGVATELGVRQIAETEWPLFGACFYLWATESLQSQWEQDASAFHGEPRIYAREAIEAAKELVIDPGHATWVRQHWGDGYMRRENCFYRMLFISALTSHAALTGETRHYELLREETNALAMEIAESPHGWIDDYPGQCYPADVAAAIVAIMRADELLGVDRGGFLLAAQRGFKGRCVGKYGLPPFFGYSDEGMCGDDSRGSGNSYFTTFAPHVWPEMSDEWYAAYDEHFWRPGGWVAGFAEYAEGMDDKFYFDVDAGPVVDGIGTSASAFGAGAARTNGRFDQADTLSRQLIAASWPLPDGSLMMPQLLSSYLSDRHAPLLGESAIAFQLSCQPYPGARFVKEGGYTPRIVWLLMGFLVSGALLTMWPGLRLLRL